MVDVSTTQSTESKKYVGSCDRSITKKSDKMKTHHSLANGMNDKPKQSHKKRDSMRIEDETTLEYLFNNMLSLSMSTRQCELFLIAFV